MNYSLFYIIISLFVLSIILYVYWRFFFFFRDPERVIPSGNNIVSPADGTIVYIKKIDDNSIPLTIKKKKEIKLDEFLNSKILDSSCPYYIIGVFMHPTSVHVNRAPIAGVIKKIIYTTGRNLPMTATWMRVLFNRKPYELYGSHIFTNERNTILIEGILPVYITQIADIYVKKIECWVKEGESVVKGQRIGMIKMGSQVDTVFPLKKNIEIAVKEGDKVKAGESILATIS